LRTGVADLADLDRELADLDRELAEHEVPAGL